MHCQLDAVQGRDAAPGTAQRQAARRFLAADAPIMNMTYDDYTAGGYSGGAMGSCPPSIDWRATGVVGPVENQEYVG